jgi:hypothetical protein
MLLPTHRAAFGGAIAFFALCALGCSSPSTHSVIPAHEVDVALEYDGNRYDAVVAFPAHDPDEKWHPGDDTCSMYHGNCGYEEPTVGTLAEGDAPIVKAKMTSMGMRTYDIDLARNPTDEAAYAALDSYPRMPSIACRIYEAELGTPQRCYYTTKDCTITVTARTGASK